MPSNYRILYHPLLLLPSIIPSIRVFSNESVLHIRWPQYWSFSFNISPSNEFKTDLLQNGLVGSPCSPRDSQESSPTPQFKSISSLVLSFLYGPTLTSVHLCVPQSTGRTGSLQRSRVCSNSIEDPFTHITGADETGQSTGFPSPAVLSRTAQAGHWPPRSTCVSCVAAHVSLISQEPLQRGNI